MESGQRRKIASIKSRVGELFDIMCRYLVKASLKEHGKQKAFTLVELLVIISIIALLLGILLPVLSKARALGLRAVCRSNLHSIGLAFRMYLDDNSNVMPPAAVLPSEADKNRRPITDFLLPYLHELKTFKCPGDIVNKYYISKGSSYEYNYRLGGKPVSKSRFVQRHGEKESNIEVMYDLDAFHGRRGKPEVFNYLYADGHVGNRERQ